MNVHRSNLDGMMRLYNSISKDTKTRLKDGENVDGLKEEVKGARYSDSITLSSDAKLIEKAVKSAPKADRVRAEKLKTIQKKIENGTYKIDASLVAEKIIECFIDEIT
jgi:flagellar biosynthesis anti-sigma factor FlgM